MRTLIGVSTIVGIATLLAACGGGERVSQTAQLDYSNAAAPRYSYAPHRSPSDIAWFADRTYVGGDVEPQQGLRHIQTLRNGSRLYMGAVRDGVGVDRLKNYETDLTTQDGDDPYGFDDDGFYPFLIAPWLLLDPAFQDPENAAIQAAVLDSLRILNDALPPEYQIEWKGYLERETALTGTIPLIGDQKDLVTRLGH